MIFQGALAVVAKRAVSFGNDSFHTLGLCIAHKLATFALGRKMDFADEAALKAMATQTIQSEAGMRTMIEALVTSELFFRP